MRLILLSALALLGACDVPYGLQQPIVSPERSGELVVIGRNGAATQFEDANGLSSGLEYDLVTAFARQYGYRVRWIDETSVDQMVTQLRHYQAHLLAASVNLSAARKTGLIAGPPYLSVTQEFVYNTAAIHPANFAELQGLRLAAVAGTWHVDTLRAARLRWPGLRWAEVSNAWEEQLLDRLSQGALDAVLVDSTSFALARHLYPNLGVAFVVGGAQPFTWKFPKASSQVLLSQVRQFFAQIEQNGQLSRLTDRYYGYVDRLEDADISGFLQKMNTVLPKYRRLFYDAQTVSGIDWRLLAAVSYQESHWDPFATSPTGVRGMMMMTGETADKMGVADRTDARQSILGGAKYLAELMELQSSQVQDQDRIWLALAAYNQGQGHVEDARVLAQRRQLDPSAWCNVKQTLPLLSGTLHQGEVKHGYCRGGEAVVFVESIRTYYDILKKYEPLYQAPLTEGQP